MKYHFCFFLLLFISVLSAVSQDSLLTAGKRRYQLEGIRVIAEKPQETIGSLEIKTLNESGVNPEFTISEVVSDIVGLYLSTGGKSGTNINIRGFRDDQIKVMLDGRPLSGGYFGELDLNTIPQSEIREIHLIKGPVSALYGSNTMGGVLNIITRGAADRKLLRTGITTRRNNTNKVYLSLAQEKKNWDFWLYASRYHTDGMILSTDFTPTTYENGAVRNNSAREQYDLQAKFNWTVANYHALGIQAGYTFMPVREIVSSIYENRYRQFTDWRRFQLSGLAALQLSHNLTLDNNIYYDQNDDAYAEYADPTYQDIFPQWPSDLSSWTFGISSRLTWDTHDIFRQILGYRYEKEAYNRKDNGSYLEWTSNNLQQHNLLWQGEIGSKTLKLTLGNGISLFRQKYRNNWIIHLEPAAGLFWKTNSNWILSLAYSLNTKYPSLHELFSQSSGNPDLQEERAVKWELSVDFPYSWHDLAGSLTQKIYYNSIHDLIERISESYENIFEARSYGYEASLRLYCLWEHQIDYSLVLFTDESDMKLLEFPRNALNIREKLNLPLGIALTYRAQWKDIRPTAESEDVLSSYWLHSVNIEKKWSSWKLLFGLDNIFDQNYQTEYGYPAAGIDFILSLETELF